MKAYPSIGKAIWLACCIRPLLAGTVPDPAGLTIGQGYNTFLGKRLVRDAVIITPKDGAPSAMVDQSERPGDENSTGTFHFTEPGPVMPGVSLNEYFTATTPEELAKIIEEAKKAPSDKEKRDDDSKVLRNEKLTREGCPGEINLRVDFVSDYRSYMKTLGVNAAATISGYGQSASVSGGYLDASAFSSNTLTFVATTSIKKQRQIPDEEVTFNSQLYEDRNGSFPTDFGDRWVSGFSMGGKQITRITLQLDESSDKEEIKAAAQASFQYLGVSGEVSTETKNNLEKVNKKAKVSVVTFYQGDIGGELQGQSKSSAQNPAQKIFEDAQSWSGMFLDKACDQNYRFEALLDQYTTIGNFPREQSVPDYTIASEVAYSALKDMVKATELKQTLETQGNLREDESRLIESDEIKLRKAYKLWMEETAMDPANAEFTSPELIGLSEAFLETWRRRLHPESSKVEITFDKAFGHKESLLHPGTNSAETYLCSQWYEWYGDGGWTWSRVRFCLPTQTEVFRLDMFREKSQYYWGSAWYWEKDAYPSYVTVGVDLKRIDGKPGSWKFNSGETTNMSFNVGGQQEKLQPGRYTVQANYHQSGPFWDETQLGKVVEFDITVSRSS